MEGNNKIIQNIENRKKKNKKTDLEKKIELLEIDIIGDIADILVKKKIEPYEKVKVDDYLKKQIKLSYNVEENDNRPFINLLKLYVYGRENSLSYFKNKREFIEKDKDIKIVLYINMLESLLSVSINNFIKDDINNINKYMEEITIDGENNENTDNISIFSYKSSVSNSFELLERNNDILEVENHDLQTEIKKIKSQKDEIYAKYNELLKENNKNKEKNMILSKYINNKIKIDNNNEGKVTNNSKNKIKEINTKSAKKTK